MDIGESLVGSYMRYVRDCDVVTYNTYLRGKQGELDVIAMRTSDRIVWLCEVTTHISGMGIVGTRGQDVTVAKVEQKLLRAKEFAQVAFPEHEHRFEVWSPRVAVGKTTRAFETLITQFETNGDSLTFVINQDYTERVRELTRHARDNVSATSEPAFRMLQIMTHLRGTSLSL